jgi:hypothetical protein
MYVDDLTIITNRQCKIQYEQIISLQKKTYGYLIFRNEKQTNSDHMMPIY